MTALALSCRKYGPPLATVAPGILIGMGIVLRVAQYLFNRSLWLDEAKLALNIIQRPMTGLFLPLDYDQGAPLGFLVIEKLAVYALGNSEYALRLFPLLSGIAALFLFYLVAREFIESTWVLVALALFVLLDPLVYYASEVKQYSSDITVTLLIYYVSIKADRGSWRLPWLAGFALMGAVSIWFSHPAILALSGIGLALSIYHGMRRDYDIIRRLMIASVLPLTSFAIAFFSSFAALGGNQSLLADWQGGFAPFPPLSSSGIQWYINNFFQLFSDPVGLSLPGLGAMAFIVGCASLLSREPRQGLILLGPIAMALVASAIRRYPFSGRLLLFLVPLILISIGEGARQVTGKTRGLSLVVAIAFVGLLLYHPTVSAARHLVKPQTAEEIRPTLDYVKEHQQAQDTLYLYYSAQYAFDYYLPMYRFDSYIVGIEARTDPAKYIADLDRLRGTSRVWVLFTHNYDWAGRDEQQFFLDYLDRIGKQQDSFTSPGSMVYLYDLSVDPK